MASSILSIGLSGINAAQAGLVTTSHNVANVATPGYSRQEVVQGTREPLYTGGGFIGRGTNVETVRRIYSTFLAAQTQQATASAAHLDTLRTQLQQLDNVLGDSSAGLGPTLGDFYASVNAVAGSPSDLATRQVMIADAQALVSRFHLVAGQLAEQQDSANDQIVTSLAAINGYATQIADLNRRIAELTAASGGLQQPNDLLDQRDALVGELNGQVGVTVVPQSDGSLNVFLSSGQALVVGTVASALVTAPDATDPRNVQFGIKTAGGTVRLDSRDFNGGVIGGLLEFRDHALTQAQDALGQIALVLARTFNDQHALGIDLTGAAGGPFFREPAPEVQPALTNLGTASLAVTLTDASALTASDYRLAYDGANYTLTRLADRATWSFGSLPQTVDGLQIGIAAGTVAAGDSFLVQPTRYAAAQIEVAIADPRKVAVAAPIATTAASGNLGSGRISAGAVGAAYPGSATTYAPGAPVPYTDGAAISFGGIEFVLSGTPANNDTFTVAPNANPAGDNRNAVLLTQLQTSRLVGGQSTLDGAFSQLVGNVGALTHRAQIEGTAQDALLTQAQRAQQEVSGVNLDEEAANLQRYQQAYQASAKVLAIASTLFDTILSIGA